MQPWEFLVFMCRITYEYYQKGNYNKESMHTKLEQLLPKWLEPVYAQPIFGFNEGFEYDKKMLKKAERARKRQLGITDSEGDDEEEEDASSSSQEERVVEESEPEEKTKKQKENADDTTSESNQSKLESSSVGDFDSDDNPQIEDGMSMKKYQRICHRFFLTLDENQDGILSLAEFKKFCTQCAKANHREDFKIEAGKALGQSLWSAMFVQFVSNKDGNAAWVEIWEFLKENKQ